MSSSSGSGDSRLHRILSSLYSAAVDVILPRTCAGCARVGEWFCPSCQVHLRADVVDGCQRCGGRGSSGRSCHRCQQLFPERLSGVRAGFSYDGPIRRAVQRFKYHGEYRRGYDLGARLLERMQWSGLTPIERIDLVVPVPLHPRRMRVRGFNQAEILAEAIAPGLDIPVVPALVRARDTQPQVRLRADQRRENVENAFAVDDGYKEMLRGSRVLLVDDVFTTGATIGSAAAELQGVGVSRIHGLTLARDR